MFVMTLLERTTKVGLPSMEKNAYPYVEVDQRIEFCLRSDGEFFEFCYILKCVTFIVINGTALAFLISEIVLFIINKKLVSIQY